MSKKKKVYITLIIVVSMFGLAFIGMMINKSIQYKNAEDYADEKLNPSNYSKIEYLEPIINKNGDEDAYVFYRYTTTSNRDIVKLTTFINELRYTNFIEGNTNEVGVPRKLSLYDINGKLSLEILFNKKMDSLMFSNEEIPRYTHYPLFQETEIPDIMKDETKDIYDDAINQDSIG